MTPDELAAIRARVALYADPEWRGTHSPKWVEVACDDAAALLAEMDRLRAVTIGDIRSFTKGENYSKARILAVVEALDTDGWSVRRGEVIAAIEGEAK